MMKAFIIIKNYFESDYKIKKEGILIYGKL